MGKSKDNDDLLAQAKEHFREAKSAWGTNHEQMLSDLEFLSGVQWPEDVKVARENDRRPCLTINKLPTFVDQVVGDQLQNRPQVRFLPVDDVADPETAEVLTGIMRSIEQTSDADIAYDTGSDSAVSCGMGAWRVLTEYANNDEGSFDQDIRIERILNRFSVMPDPTAQRWSYEDGRYFFITEEMPKEAFKSEYPNAVIAEWEGSEHTDDWSGPDSIRVAEYFYEKRISKGVLSLIEFPDGVRQTVKELPGQIPDWPYEVKNKRNIEKREIWWCKLSGYEILDGPQKWIGDLYPIVLIWGKELVLEKKRIYRGVVRHARDSQKLYNYSRSYQAETTALAPKAPFLATPKQISGHEHQWNSMPTKNWPYVLYNPDPMAPGPPQRQAPPIASSAHQTEVTIADQELHDTTGLQQASLGKRSNETSGVAIVSRQREGDVANYSYMNNLSRAIKYTGKVILDLAPKIYDTPRIAQMIGEDGAEKTIQVNQPYQDEITGKPKMHDLRVGKYDVAVTVGPSFTTKRQESAASMIDFIKAAPAVAPAVMDLVAKNLDWPGAREFQKRLEKMLPEGVKELTLEEKQEKEAEEPQVDPMVQLQLQQEQAKLEIDMIKVEQEKMKLKALAIDNDLKLANLAMQAEQHEQAKIPDDDDEK